MAQKGFITMKKINRCVRDHVHVRDYVHAHAHENDHVRVHENDCDHDCGHENIFWVLLIICAQIRSVIFNEEVVPFVVIIV